MSDREIELKFGFYGNADNLRAIFEKLGRVSNESTLNLENTYFDTDTKELFAIHAGLRIRHADSFSEQTLKVKGENIGGLHKRLEYNLPIDKELAIPNLHKFPKDAFGDGYDIEGVQKRLKPQCKINFKRHLFNVEMLDSVFEVAYDNGFIIVGDKQYPLNELEIELKETKLETDDYLKLFSIVCTHLASKKLPLQLEPFSKMHRAALLAKESKASIDYTKLIYKNNFIDYLTYVTEIFENLYGYFLVNNDPVLLAQITSILETLILGLKRIKKGQLLAFEKEQREPIDYKQDLVIIIKLLQKFKASCEKCNKKLLSVTLLEKTENKAKLVKKLREKERDYKLFTLPLKIRLLLSMFGR